MDNQTRTQVRMPDEISKWLKARAKEQDRSMNSEIIRILREKKKEEATKAV